MNTQVKKILSPQLHCYNGDMRKRWRVEWWEVAPNGYDTVRKVSSKGINKHTTPEKRYHAGRILIQQILEGVNAVKQRQVGIIEKVMNAGALEWRDKTHRTYNTIALAFERYLGALRAENATESTIESFLLKLRQEGKAPGTIFRYRNALSIFYNKAIALGLCSYNPVKKVAPIKRAPVSLTPFTQDQVQHLKIAMQGKQIWLAVELLYYCFIRPRELRFLRVGHINIELRTIQLPGSISKNKKTESIAIPDAILPSLQFLKQYGNTSYIFTKTGQPGPTPVSENYLYREHAKALKMVEINGNYSFYSWKHTGAVACVRAGIHIKDLQLQLRHHSLDQVNEYLRSMGVAHSEDLKHKFPSL